jgi:hypothetical protein
MTKSADREITLTGTVMSVVYDKNKHGDYTQLRLQPNGKKNSMAVFIEAQDFVAVGAKVTVQGLTTGKFIPNKNGTRRYSPAIKKAKITAYRDDNELPLQTAA